MKLIAILNWYDEPATWLASCVASLARIGVDHLIASDGAYPHYPDAKPRSGMEQAESITRTCDALDIGLTLDRPQFAERDEVQKRSYQFALATAAGTKFEDWVFIIDADEVISESARSVKAELAETDRDVAHAYLWEALDPYAAEGKNNNERTEEIYRKIPNEHRFGSLQTRFWRLLDNLRVEHNHYTYLGDRDGVTYSLRGRSELADELGIPTAKVFTPETLVEIEHRDWYRTAWRSAQKKLYYEHRDRSGIERAAKVTT